jgi:hypothetical protein
VGVGVGAAQGEIFRGGVDVGDIRHVGSKGKEPRFARNGLPCG